MTPLLLVPLGLAALAALAVPLLIHLYRRTEQVPVDFAALRWLEQRPRPRRRLRFDEWPLLVVRLLLVAALAVLLAEPAIRGGEDRRPRVLVAPGAGAGARGLGNVPAADVRWLAPGFPTTDTPVPRDPAPTASLIRQFDAELPPGAPLTVIVPAELAGADADRLRLTRPVRWRTVPGSGTGAPARDAAVPRLALRLPARGDAGAGFLTAAAAAWSPDGSSRAEATRDTALPAPDRILVWLRPGTVPAAVRDRAAAGGTVLIGHDTAIAMPAATAPLWTDAVGATVVEGASLGRGRLLRFTRPLSPAAMPALLEPDFAMRLRALLAPAPPPPDRVAARDYAPIAGVAAYPRPPRALGAWLALLIALLFAVERWLATGRRRSAGA